MNLDKDVWSEQTYNKDGSPSWNVIYTKNETGETEVFGYFYCPYIPIVVEEKGSNNE